MESPWAPFGSALDWTDEVELPEPRTGASIAYYDRLRTIEYTASRAFGEPPSSVWRVTRADERWLLCESGDDGLVLCRLDGPELKLRFIGQLREGTYVESWSDERLQAAELHDVRVGTLTFDLSQHGAYEISG